LPNGSIIKSGIAGNGQRGDRANMLVIDERAFIKSGVINDVLKSIVTEPRKSVKDGKPGVHEFNSIKAVTSAGYYGSEGYEEYVKKLGLMSKTHNGEMVLTSNYQLVAFADNHGYDKKGAQKFKDSMTQLEWEMNMESNWGGASTEGGIVSIDTIELSRNIEDAEHIAEDDAEYIFAYDIARNYSSKKRDDSALVIGKIIRNSNGQVGRVAVVNVLTVDAHEKFEEQAHRIKVLDELFNPKVVVIDANIIGLGVMEFLMKETKGDDKIYPAFNTLNTPEEPDTENYVNKLFALQSSRAETKQSDIVIAFMNHFRSRNVDLLTAPLNGITSAKTKDEFTQHVLPHYECSRMIDELLNLQIKENKNGGVSISRATRAIDKDKAMALMYLVFYAFKKLDDDTNKKNIDVKKYLRLIR